MDERGAQRGVQPRRLTLEPARGSAQQAFTVPAGELAEHQQLLLQQAADLEEDGKRGRGDGGPPPNASDGGSEDQGDGGSGCGLSAEVL